MQLLKPHLDVGLFTNQRDAQLEFWQQGVGLGFDHLGKLGGGVHQLRHHMNGSILKINHARDPLPADAPCAGWHELLIARDGIAAPTALHDPDGNRVTLVPPGYLQVTGIGLRVRTPSVQRALDFYLHVMGAAPVSDCACMLGDSVLIFEEDPGRRGVRPPYRARGLRYITVQIADCDAHHQRLLAAGAEEGRPPRTIGTTTRYSFVLDADANWIEISHRAAIAGALEGDEDGNA